ncbi:MAG: LON peptidase substrate-binding domain-containing protein [Rhodospirillales bacterium]
MPSRQQNMPPSIPVFPLPGALLLPGGHLPLNIFEPRYLNMVEDALGQGRLIGMIQPREQARDPIDGAAPLYSIGCVGRIISFSETGDRRFMITLEGVSRFSCVEELPTTRGYRRFTVDWEPFIADLTDAAEIIDNRDRLLAALRAFFTLRGFETDWDAVERAPDHTLVNSLAMICPLELPEKQALLESDSLGDRSNLLTTMLEMAAHDTSGRDLDDSDDDPLEPSGPPQKH